MNLQPIESLDHILLIFIDGLGIGQNDKNINPCISSNSSFFNHTLDEVYPKQISPNGYVLGLDANLGISGLPQSATGQTALLTGINAAKLLGRHLNAFPNQRLREVIAEHSLMKKLVHMRCKAAFLNTFRPPFFDYDPQDIIRHLSVTTLTNYYAGLPFFNLDDLLHERSIYQDMTNEALQEKGFDIPLFTPEKAGQIVGKQTQHYFFSMYEYFQTDKAGHSKNMQRARDVITRLDHFLTSVLQSADLTKTLVILTSDHGNIENMSFKGHTRNPAMTLLFGARSREFLSILNKITDITPAILLAANKFINQA